MRNKTIVIFEAYNLSSIQMSQYQDSKELFARSTVSRGEKQKDILWNVLEPGDPYDIRKSMIAKLPGEEKRFMGNHPEIVCLLQAAEIERLHEYLQEYRERYLELERKELDRHSYEVQIKELTERLVNGEQLRIENSKLKAFISKLEAEIQSLKRSGNSDLSEKYNAALLSISNLSSEKSRLESENSSLRYQLDSLTQQLEAFERSKRRDIESLEMRLEEASRARSQPGLKEQLEAQIRSLQKQNQRLNEMVLIKNHEIEDLYSAIRSLERQNAEMASRTSSINQYESKIALLSQEIERLNILLRDKSSRYEEIHRERSMIENQLRVTQGEKARADEEVRRKEGEINPMRLIIQQLEEDKRKASSERKSIEEYERRLQEAGNEIDRLNTRLRKEISEKEQLKANYQQLAYQNSTINILERENQDLKGRIGDINTLHRQLAEYENKMALLSSEIERLRGVSEQVKPLREENNQLRRQVESLRAELERVDRTWNDRHNSEINNVRTEYSRKITTVIQEKDQSSLKKIGQIGSQIDRLNALLQRYQKENNDLKIQNNELVNLMNKRDNEVRNLQMEIDMLHNQLDEFSKVKQSFSSTENKLTSLERELGLARQQIRGLNDLVKQLQDRNREIEDLLKRKDNQLLDLRARTMRSDEEQERLKNEVNLLLRDLDFLKKENAELKNRLRDIEINHSASGRDLEAFRTRVETLTRERQLIIRDVTFLKDENENLKKNLNDLQGLKDEINLLRQENATLRTDLDRLRKSSNEGMVSVTNNYETKITKYTQEITSFEKELNNARNQLKRLEEILRERDAKIDALQYQLNSLRSSDDLNRNQNNDLKRDLERLKAELSKVKRELEESENLHNLKDQKLNDLLNEIDRLTSLLKRKYDEGVDKDNKVKNISNEYEQIKSREGYIQKDLEFYRHENDNLKQRITTLENEIRQYQSKFQLLNTELDRLQDLVGVKDNIIKSSDARVKENESLLSKFEREIRETQEARRILESKVSESTYVITRHESTGKEQQTTIESLRLQIEEIKREMRELERQYQKEIDNLRRDKSKVEVDFSRKNDELSQRQYDYQRILEKVTEVERKYVILEKKKKIKDINEKDYSEKINFLEEEADRLKKEKDSIQSKDVAQLKIQIEKLLAENLNLKNYNEELIRELQLRNNYADKRDSELRETYEKRISILEKELLQIKSTTMTKEYVKNIISKTNQDVVKRNQFYEDEIKRTRGEGSNQNRKLRDEINKLMDDLQKEEKKKISIEEKVRYYEETIDTLDKKLDRLMEELANKDNEIREANSRYSEFRVKFEDSSTKLRQKEELNDTFRRDLERLNEESGRLRTDLANLKNLEWKIQEYESKINVFHNTIANLENYNTKIQSQFQTQREKYQALVAQLREFEEILEELTKKYRQLQFELNTYKEENASLLKKITEYTEIERKASSLEFETNRLKDMVDKVSKDKEIEGNNLRDNQNNMKKQYDSTIFNLDQTIIKITQENQANKNKVKDLDALQRTIAQMKQEIEYLKDENSKKTKTITDNLDQIRRANENNSSLRDKNDQANRKISELASEVDRLNDLLDKKIAESEICMEKTLKENIELRKRFESFQGQGSKLTENERRIQILIDENKEMSDKLSTMRRRNEEDLDKLRASEEQNRQNKMMIESLKESINHTERSVNMTRESLNAETEELRKRTNSIPELNSRIANLERDLLAARSQIAGLKQSLNIRDQEMLRLKKEGEDMNSLSTRNKQAMSEDYRRLQIEYNSLLREYENAKNKAMQNDVTMKEVSKEFERLQQIINKLKTERMSIIEKNRVLGSQIDRLSNVNRDLTGTVEEMRLSLSDMMTLEKRLQEQLALMVVLFAEIESLRNQLDAKNRQAEETKRDSLTPYRL